MARCVGAMSATMGSATQSWVPHSRAALPWPGRLRAAASRRRPGSRSCGKVAAAADDEPSGTALLTLSGPPTSFDYRTSRHNTTKEVVTRDYPELQDLVDEGALVVISRPADYVERRTDGYQEPQQVFLVATAHLSRKSCLDVERVIQAVQPENVVVELCKSRAGLMYESPTGDKEKASNPMSISGNSFLGAVGRAARLGGQSALGLRLLLGRLSKRLSDQMGMEVGSEMRAARLAALAIPDSQVVLGDRPIEITLDRAWAALTWQQRLQLGVELTRGLFAPMPEMTPELIESLKQDDAVSMLFDRLAQKYPKLLSALVHERDMYLAWSLKRSKAVNGTERVVGVVGRGHLRGIVFALTTDSGSLRFKDLVGGKNTRASKQQFARNVGKRVAWEIAVWGTAAAVLSVVFT